MQFIKLQLALSLSPIPALYKHTGESVKFCLREKLCKFKVELFIIFNTFLLNKSVQLEQLKISKNFFILYDFTVNRDPSYKKQARKKGGHQHLQIF